jgi:hypothetical protein
MSLHLEHLSPTTQLLVADLHIPHCILLMDHINLAKTEATC